MNDQQERQTMEDVLDAFVASAAGPDSAPLAEWIRRYPQYERELTEFAASWSLMRSLPPSPDAVEVDEETLALRGMSVVQNLLNKQQPAPTAPGRLDFGRLQDEVGAWADRNFDPADQIGPVLGAVEEVGELAAELGDDPHIAELTRALGRLAHATLKARQGIRGTSAVHDAQAQDAIADTIVFMANLCHRRGWDLQAIVETTWQSVAARDWRRDPVTGRGESA